MAKNLFSPLLLFKLRRIRTHILWQWLLLPMRRPKTLVFIIVAIVLWCRPYKFGYNITRNNYFKLQSDRDRQTLLKSTCEKIETEENSTKLLNRVDVNVLPVPEKTDQLYQSIIELTGITRNYTKEILASLIRCRTLNIDNLRSIIMKEQMKKRNREALFISPEAKVEYTRYASNMRLPQLAVLLEGRLENVMGNYASLYALKKLYGVSAVLKPNENSEFIDNFQHLSIPAAKKVFGSHWLGLPVDVRFGINFGALQLAALGLLGPHQFLAYDYSFEMHLFHPFRNELRKEFKFSDEVTNKGKKFLSDIIKSEPNKEGITFIGIYGRFREIPFSIKQIIGADQVNYNTYFPLAISYYKNIFKNPVFIAASDDVDEMKNTFGKLVESMVYYSEGTPIEDLALLSQCNHSIVTLGAFSFWSAYLGSGKAVFPDIKTDYPHRFSKDMFKEIGLTDFIPQPYQRTDTTADLKKNVSTAT